MALYKEIRQEDGVITNYHRIIYVTNTINSHNSIAVVSYVDEESRGNDAVINGDMRPYRKATTYEMEYVENLTVEDAYKWLKTLPQYEGSEDI